MADVHRVRILPLVSIIAIAWIGAIGARPAFAQQTPLEQFIYSISPSRTVPPAPPALPAGCIEDYWIISSRSCPQHGVGVCGNCRFNYYQQICGQYWRHPGPEGFLSWLKPGVPLCIVVHGSFTPEDDLHYRSRHMYHWIRSAAPHLPLQVVFFSWPSNGPFMLVPCVDIGMLGRKSAFNGLYLAQLISQIPGDRPICLVGHSHGARTASSALHLLAGGEVQGHRHCWPDNPTRRMRAVFLAAAMDHDWLDPGERYGRALCRLEALLIARNHCDRALHFYPLLPFSRQALGDTGLTPKDRQRMGWLGGRVAEVDVAPLIGSHHFWQYYYSRPEIAASIAPYVYFPDLRQTHRETRRATPQRPAPIAD